MDNIPEISSILKEKKNQLGGNRLDYNIHVDAA